MQASCDDQLIGTALCFIQRHQSEFALPLWESISHITVYLSMSVTDQCKEKKRHGTGAGPGATR